MCGIAGIYAYSENAPPPDRGELRRMRDRMAARGPDGAGEWCSDDSRIRLGHRRLSIIDLSEAGAQPMKSSDRDSVITFNGEIYNFGALRTELEARGRVFRTRSDTEVLLHLYAEKGEDMVRDLRGMFAFALWDSRRRRLFLARDPYGIKPLYYADDGGTFRFASQVKALLAGGGVSREQEPAGLVGFYMLGSVPEPYTIYRSIRSLEAGSTLLVDADGQHESRRYFSVAETYSVAERKSSPLTQPARAEFVREALLDSVWHHLVADVPVGAFLSAGIDSGALVGLMRDAGQRDIQTVTISFSEFRHRHDDEAPLAELVARQYGTQHTTRVVTEREFHDDLPKVLDAMDQPSVDGINTWFVAKAAHELGLKVAISGLGGDELFGGYSTFDVVPRWVKLLSLPSRIPFLGEGFRYAGAGLASASQSFNPKAAGLLKYGGNYPGAYLLFRGLFMQWELGAVLDPETVREGLRKFDSLNHIDATMKPVPPSAFSKIAALESSLYMRNQLLRDTDWASMAHSLEVRVPLVDAALLARVAPVVGVERSRGSKAMLAQSPRKKLPRSITERRKTGFGTPVSDWLQRSGRLERWKRIPALSGRRCSWARRWAYQIAGEPALVDFRA